ncbi:autotransporter-associated beta strand repeat-containing protein [Paraburkholderia sediminicola]|uniref:beta strand repeat-containing protein n=1 Tax=Paraburkholderia sediminicola TaxID=458836 RepID=UPI0038BB3D28
MAFEAVWPKDSHKTGQTVTHATRLIGRGGVAESRDKPLLRPISASILLIGVSAAVSTAQAQTISFTTNSTVDIGDSTTSVTSLLVSNNVTGTLNGVGGTLVYSGGAFRLGGTANGTQQTLNMSGLSNFISSNATQAFSISGQITAVGGSGSTSGSMTLAGSNTITAATFGVGDFNRSVSNSATNAGTVLLGQSNMINADQITIGNNQASGTLAFQSGSNGGTLVLRGTDGSSPVGTWNIAVGVSSNYTGNNGTVDLSRGSLDAKIGNLLIGSAGYGSQSAIGSLSMGAGTLNATSVTLGQRSSTVGAGAAQGTLTIAGGTVLTQSLTLGDFSGTTGSATGTVNLNSGATLRALSIQPGAGSATRTINWNDGTLGNYADGGNMTVSGAQIRLSDSGTHTFQIDGANALATVSSTLSNAGGAVTGGTLVKAGTGTLALTAANTYSGGTTVTGGLVNFQNLSDLGTGNVTLNGGGLQWASGVAADVSGRLNPLGQNGGVFDTNGNDVTLATGLTGTGGSLAKQGAGVLTLTGNNTYTGGTVIGAGTLQLGNGGPSGSIVGNVTDNGTFVIDRSDTVTLPGVISGTGSVNQHGSGTVILAADNTYTGGTTISAGTLQVGNGGTAGSIVSDVTDNGALAFNRSDTLTYGGAVSGTGSLEQAGTGTLILTGNNTYTGTTTISAGTLQLGNGGAGGSIAGNVNNDGALVFDRSDSLVYDGTVSGTGSVTQAGSGKVVLNGAQTYSGNTNIVGGTLVIGDSAHTGAELAGGGQVNIAAGGAFGGYGKVTGPVVNDGLIGVGNALPALANGPDAVLPSQAIWITVARLPWSMALLAIAWP